jgi:uncharacterized protein (TIGR02453 family)
VSKAYFGREAFRFLSDLRKHNNREWFLANKARYEADVRDPFLRFIADLAHPLRRISPYIEADPRPTGGSLFRIYRDVRFSADKSPYKTHAAAWFRCRTAPGDVAGPGFYLQIAPGECFAGGGIWHPDARTLGRIRTAIAEKPKAWSAVRRKRLEIEGDTLTRPPKGFDPEHPYIEDLKRKDFVTTISYRDAQVVGPRFLQDFVAACRKMSPLMEFLAGAVGGKF